MKKWHYFLILFFMALILFKLEQLQESPDRWFGLGSVVMMTACIIGAGWNFISKR